MRVLVIDDSEVARGAMDAILTLNGHVVFTAPSPIGTIGITLKERIDVVVVDINMPGLCGDRLVELFRKQPKLRDIGIVLVSGMPVSELRVIRERCGADAEVSKSQLSEQLPDAISEAFARREARLGRSRPGKTA